MDGLLRLSRSIGISETPIGVVILATAVFGLWKLAKLL
jgi:hypothetical protein